MNNKYKESQKTDVVDSIFFGIYFKMTAKSFYEHCNNMHKKGIFRGSYDYQVVVSLNDGFKKPVQLRFYPSFDKPFISSVPCRFTYANANIYKKSDRADLLIKEVIPALMTWHGGNQFIEIPAEHPWKASHYVKVDANRKITVFESDNSMDVEVIYEDLRPLHEISSTK